MPRDCRLSRRCERLSFYPLAFARRSSAPTVVIRGLLPTALRVAVQPFATARGSPTGTVIHLLRPMRIVGLLDKCDFSLRLSRAIDAGRPSIRPLA